MDKRFSLKFVLTLMLLTLVLTSMIISALFILIINPVNNSPSLLGLITNQTNDRPGLFGFFSRSRNQNTNEVQTFAELMELISSRFIGDFDNEDIMYAAMWAAVDSLDDYWSYFMSPEEYMYFRQRGDNRYSGIGVDVVVDEETGGIKVLGVRRESGAYAAGIVAGDIITAVDGMSILGFTIAETRQALQRPLGETALVTVLREDDQYYDLTVIYNLVFIDPVSYEMLDGDIGYIVLRNFDTRAAERFISAVNVLIEQGATAFIYDVRSNPGGKVTEMTMILDFLLPEGEIFISVNSSGTEQIIRSDEDYLDMPAVVIVNSYSFSGAEYFAAILCEYDYAYTVGEQTTGKNRMQTTFQLSDGSAVHISTGEYLTKNRVSLYDTGGFTPGYLIELTEDEFGLFLSGDLSIESDPQLQKAIFLLAG